MMEVELSHGQPSKRPSLLDYAKSSARQIVAAQSRRRSCRFEDESWMKEPTASEILVFVRTKILKDKPLYYELSKQELESILLKELGPVKMVSDLIQNLFQECDEDGNERVTVEELTAYIQRIRPSSRWQRRHYVSSRFLLSMSVWGMLMFLTGSMLSATNNLMKRLNNFPRFSSMIVAVIMWLFTTGSFVFLLISMYEIRKEDAKREAEGTTKLLTDMTSQKSWKTRVIKKMRKLLRRFNRDFVNLDQGINLAWLVGSFAYLIASYGERIKLDSHAVSHLYGIGGILYLLGGVLCVPSDFLAHLRCLVSRQELQLEIYSLVATNVLRSGGKRLLRASPDAESFASPDNNDETGTRIDLNRVKDDFSAVAVHGRRQRSTSFVGNLPSLNDIFNTSTSDESVSLISSDYVKSSPIPTMPGHHRRISSLSMMDLNPDEGMPEYSEENDASDYAEGNTSEKVETTSDLDGTSSHLPSLLDTNVADLVIAEHEVVEYDLQEATTLPETDDNPPVQAATRVVAGGIATEPVEGEDSKSLVFQDFENKGSPEPTKPGCHRRISSLSHKNSESDASDFDQQEDPEDDSPTFVLHESAIRDLDVSNLVIDEENVAEFALKPPPDLPKPSEELGSLLHSILLDGYAEEEKRSDCQVSSFDVVVTASIEGAPEIEKSQYGDLVQKILLVNRQQDPGEDSLTNNRILQLMDREPPPEFHRKLGNLRKYFLSDPKEKDKTWLKGQRLSLTFIELLQIMDERISETIENASHQSSISESVVSAPVILEKRNHKRHHRRILSRELVDHILGNKTELDHTQFLGMEISCDDLTKDLAVDESNSAAFHELYLALIESRVKVDLDALIDVFHDIDRENTGVLDNEAFLRLVDESRSSHSRWQRHRTVVRKLPWLISFWLGMMKVAAGLLFTIGAYPEGLGLPAQRSANMFLAGSVLYILSGGYSLWTTLRGTLQRFDRLEAARLKLRRCIFGEAVPISMEIV